MIYIFEKYSNKNIVREVKIGGRHRSTDINKTKGVGAVSYTHLTLPTMAVV